MHTYGTLPSVPHFPFDNQPEKENLLALSPHPVVANEGLG